MMPHGPPVKPRKADDDIQRVAGLHFQKIAEVHHARDDGANVVTLLVIDRHDCVHVRVGLDPRLRACAADLPDCSRARSSAVLRQHARPLVVFGDEVDHAGVHVRLGAAQFFAVTSRR